MKMGHDIDQVLPDVDIVNILYFCAESFQDVGDYGSPQIPFFYYLGFAITASESAFFTVLKSELSLPERIPSKAREPNLL